MTTNIPHRATLFLDCFPHLCQPPLVSELVLPRPLFGHEVVGPDKHLLELSNVQYGHGLNVVAKDEAAQILDVVDPAVSQDVG
jgi:hypothetical protein